ncbi:MAG: hypothetical protein K0R79_2517 [Stenotrophomonas indicatrix]|jgi:hypothetical protein|nr:hypothetical protein [Stenotrophomonas indicatrix]CRD57012.1 conserved hypothetical protein [Stenotrophomonas indicatrix]
MSASTYPYLFATLGEAAHQLPHDIARALETTLTATQAANAPGGPTLLDCRSASARWKRQMASRGRAKGERRRSAWRWRASTAPMPG